MKCRISRQEKTNAAAAIYSAAILSKNWFHDVQLFTLKLQCAFEIFVLVPWLQHNIAHNSSHFSSQLQKDQNLANYKKIISCCNCAFLQCSTSFWSTMHFLIDKSIISFRSTIAVGLCILRITPCRCYTTV